MGLKTMDDLHKPALDQIGFQELITEQMAFWDTAYEGDEWVQRSAGKQPAWIHYMTNVNKTYGNFAIVQDTDLLSTIGYYRIYNKDYKSLLGYKRALQLFERSKSDLYIMPLSNIPFTPDPLS